ncbi:hypothetical protein J3E69DRAFT_373784 [Trichoderma sp. SZMC 28015]
MRVYGSWRKAPDAPAAENFALGHMGCQFQEIYAKIDAYPSELAYEKIPNYTQFQDNESWVKNGGRPTQFNISSVSVEWYLQSERDPWTPLSLRSRASSTYLQELRQFLRSIDAKLGGVADAEITTTQSVQTYSKHPTTSQDVPRASLEVQVAQSTYSQSSEGLEETETVYSDQSSVGERRTLAYISFFTRYAYQQIRPLLTRETAEKAIDLLPELLREFALSVGQSSHSQINQDIKYDVHKHRHTIAHSLMTLYKNDQATATKGQLSEAFASRTNKTNPRWTESPHTDNASDLVKNIDSFAYVDEEGYPPQDFADHHETVMVNSSFQWVVEKLRRELDQVYQASVDQSAMDEISDRIIGKVGRDREIHRRHPPKPNRMEFEVTCDILGYVEDQGFSEHAADVLPKAITLTGSSVNAQALTIEQYVQQTWPMIGCHLVQTIQKALRAYTASESLSHSSRYIFPTDGTEVKVTMREKTFNVEVIGTAHLIADIAAQLGWLAATLALSIVRGVIPFCYPDINSFRANPRHGFRKSFFCRINVATKEMKPNLPDVNGQCWHRVFNNPIIVTGYPILARTNSGPETGLELPLGMMIDLSNCEYLTTWKGTTLIKGFDGVLIPTKMQNNVIIWHLLVGEHGQRMSYLDPRIKEGIFVAPEILSNSRHFLGWVANAQNIIGSPIANYNIGGSGLPLTKELPVNIDVSIGLDLLKFNSRITKGNRERVISGFVDHDCYKYLIHDIGLRYVLLYDVEKKRAFLSDGHRALLHLARAWLEQDQRENPNDYYADQINKLDSALMSKRWTQATAENILLSADKLQEADEQMESMYHTFKDRVKRIGARLERMAESIIDMINNNEISESNLKNNTLDGWDFMDVAAGGPLRLQTVKLPPGVGWINLVHSILAIPLFGTNFGELIKPCVNDSASSCNQCGFEASLPSGKYLMAAKVDLLQKILMRYGSKDANTNPRRLIDKLHWYIREPGFGPCRCSSGSSKSWSSNDWIQRICTPNMIRGPTRPSPVDLEPNGAVIFGHSRKFIFPTSRNTPLYDSICPSEDSPISEVPICTIPQENSEANEDQMSDTVSSSTPNNSTWSGTDGMNTAIEPKSSTSNTVSIKPEDPAAKPIPIPRIGDIGTNTCTTKQNRTSNVVAAELGVIATVPPILSAALPTAPQGKSAGRIRYLCARTWKKLKRHKGSLSRSQNRA